MLYTNKDLRKLITPLVFEQLLINITAALATGGAVAAGHYLGQKDTENACKWAWQLLLFSAELSVVVTVVFLTLYRPLLRIIFGQVEPAVMDNAGIYLVITALSICLLRFIIPVRQCSVPSMTQEPRC